MLGRTITVLTALSALVILAGGTPCFGQLKGSDSVVKASATASKPDEEGKQEVTITLTITNKEFYLYANPVRNELLENNQVKVTFAQVESAKIDYPTGEVKTDKEIGKFNVYKNKATIKATVKRAKGQTGPLDLTIKVYACDKSKCLAPSDIKLSVP
jgi:hypothetical protein